MTKKIAIPANPLIYRTAATYAAIFYDAGRSAGLTSEYKTPEAFARKYMERFIPMVIKNFIEMLKPGSNCTEHMKQEIHEALTDPINDPNLMETKVDIDLNTKRLDDMIANFSKNQLKFNDITPTPKTTVKQKMLNTANPLASFKGN